MFNVTFTVMTGIESVRDTPTAMVNDAPFALIMTGFVTGCC